MLYGHWLWQHGWRAGSKERNHLSLWYSDLEVHFLQGLSLDVGLLLLVCRNFFQGIILLLPNTGSGPAFDLLTPSNGQVSAIFVLFQRLLACPLRTQCKSSPMWCRQPLLFSEILVPLLNGSGKVAPASHPTICRWAHTFHHLRLWFHGSGSPLSCWFSRLRLWAAPGHFRFRQTVSPDL